VNIATNLMVATYIPTLKTSFFPYFQRYKMQGHHESECKIYINDLKVMKLVDVFKIQHILTFMLYCAVSRANERQKHISRSGTMSYNEFVKYH
jgi:hypothetical protein